MSKMMRRWRGSTRPSIDDRPGLGRLVHQGVVGMGEHRRQSAQACFQAAVCSSTSRRISSGITQHRVGVVEVDADLVGRASKSGGSEAAAAGPAGWPDTKKYSWRRRSSRPSGVESSG